MEIPAQSRIKEMYNTSMNVGFNSLVAWLRAAGEPSRLRLLSLCTEEALSVTDLARALGQSEPRISRHLKILTAAGLIERERQGQWVHYRGVRANEAASFVQGLLAHLDKREPQLARDRAAARAGATPALTQSRLGRALGALLTAAPDTSPGRALVAGLVHPEVLRAVAGAASACVVLAPGRRAAQAARAFAGEQGLRCRVLESAATGALTLGALRAAGSFDLIVLDRAATAEGALAPTLAAARGALTPQGRVWIFGAYEALEGGDRRVVEHPLARLRRVLRECGFECERLSPVESDGEHVLAASARLSGTRAQQGAA